MFINLINNHLKYYGVVLLFLKVFRNTNQSVVINVYTLNSICFVFVFYYYINNNILYKTNI